MLTMCSNRYASAAPEVSSGRVHVDIRGGDSRGRVLGASERVVLSVQGSHSSSKETKNPTPLPEAIPEFGLQVRIDDQPYDMADVTGGEMFRWLFQQRTTFYSNLAQETHPKQKLSIPSSTCTVGNEVVLPKGETVGTSPGTSPDLEWGYSKVPGSYEQSLDRPTMNSEWNSPLFLSMDVALKVCNRTAGGGGRGL